MDKMNWFNILFVGVPETMLTIIFATLLCYGKNFWKENTSIKFIKGILSTSLILLLFNVIRSNFNSIILITALNTIVYMIVINLIFKFNCRQSVLMGSLSMFIIVFSEIVTVSPFCTFLITNLSENGFMNTKILWTIPTRLIQLIIIAYLIIRDINFKNNTLLNTKWKSLKKAKKITIFILSVFIYLSIIFIVNYSEIFVKMQINNIDITVFSNSMNLIVIQSILFLSLVLFLLSRTTRYEDYKEILSKNPEEIFEIIIDISNEKQVNNFKEIINEKLERGCNNE